MKKIFKNIWKGLNASRLSIKDQTFFIKRLSFLIKADIGVVESLHMIREQTSTKRYSKVLDSIINDVQNGQNLSTALAKFKSMFGEFAINIIHVGESTGILSQNLEYLADELKKKQQLKSKVVSAFVYPIVVTVATFGITIFLMVYLFPKIMPVFASLHMQLPLSTRIVIFLSNSLRNYGYYIFFAVLALFGAFYLSLEKIPKFKYVFEYYILKIPLVGKVVQNYNLANATRTMGLLLQGGVTLSETLPILTKTTPNIVYKREFQSLASIVNRGEKLSTHLKKRSHLFGEISGQIIAVGERSGNLASSLTYLSELYESEVDDFTKNISSLIEPVLMIFMGILVGFIAVSIITPIYSITQNLHG